MEILFLFALILLNGAFAMSEMSLVAARKGRLQSQANAGDRGATCALQLNEEPTRFLSTVQIGITAIGILNGIIGDAVLSKPVADWLKRFNLEAGTSEVIATAVVVVTITYFSIVLGELVPKRIGQMAPEAIARFVSRPVNFLAMVTKPFVKLLGGSTNLVIKVLGLRERDDSGMVEEEIHALLLEGKGSGAIEETEHELVRNVFRLDDRQLGSLMVPRGDIVSLDVGRSWEENKRAIASREHARFPLVRGSLNDIVGVISARVLLGKVLAGEVPDLAALAHPVSFVPATLTGMELLENFKKSGGDVVFVVDEYGEVQGMVTFNDVIEAITGEFKTQRAEDAWAIRREDGTWLLDGLIPTLELKDRLELASVPEEGARYHTLSGMLQLLMGRLPSTGDKVDWGGWRLEVMDMDGRRIDKVLATPLPPAEPPAPR